MSLSKILIIDQVWIYQSHLHLIPPSHISSSATKPRRRKYSSTKDSDDEGEPVDGDDEDYINVSDALKVLRDSIENTVAPKAVEEAVWNRIHGYVLSMVYSTYPRANRHVDILLRLANTYTIRRHTFLQMWPKRSVKTRHWFKRL